MVWNMLKQIFFSNQTKIHLKWDNNVWIIISFIFNLFVEFLVRLIKKLKKKSSNFIN